MEASELKGRRFTVNEYFEQLEQSLHKLEYADGEIRMMAGGTPNHSTIVDNAFFALRSNKGSCEVKSSETAIAVQVQNKYFFPDTSVVCDEKANYEDTKGIAIITNPSLIVEVLSKSTASLIVSWRALKNTF
ncbi:MAG: Uma2 family endonuclease [Neolewinella sp.]|jgi:Uma2 family endonuclease